MSFEISIFSMHEFHLVYALHDKLNWFKKTNDIEGVSLDSFWLPLENLAVSVVNKSYSGFRVALAHTVISAIGLAHKLDVQIKISKLKQIYVSERLFPREDYACYVDDIYMAVRDLECSIKENNTELIKVKLLRVLACIYLQLPEFCCFSIYEDLVCVIPTMLECGTTGGALDKDGMILEDVEELETKWSCYKNYKFECYELISNKNKNSYK